MSGKKGIKESSELIHSLVMLASAGFKIGKDGLGVDDLRHVLDLVNAHEALLDGFKDMDEIDDEIKDLDEMEAVALIGQLFKGIKSVREHA